MQFKHAWLAVKGAGPSAKKISCYIVFGGNMKKVTAIVVYPVEVEVIVPENMGPDDIWQELIKKADSRVTDDVAPVLYTCSEPMTRKEEKEINTQEEWVQNILQKLQQAKATLDPIMDALVLLKPKAHPEIIQIVHQNLQHAIGYLIKSVSQLDPP